MQIEMKKKIGINQKSVSEWLRGEEGNRLSPYDVDEAVSSLIKDGQSFTSFASHCLSSLDDQVVNVGVSDVNGDKFDFPNLVKDTYIEYDEDLECAFLIIELEEVKEVFKLKSTYAFEVDCIDWLMNQKDSSSINLISDAGNEVIFIIKSKSFRAGSKQYIINSYGKSHQEMLTDFLNNNKLPDNF